MNYELQNKKPLVRFPEFNDDWEEKKLGENIDLLSGFAFKGDEISENSNGISILRGINITEGYIRHSKKIDRYFLGNIEKLKKHLLIENDLVIGMDGSKVGKNVALITKKDENSILIQRVARLRSNENSNIHFLYQIIFSDKFINYVDVVNTSSGIPHISLKQIRDYKLSIPTIPEQKRIANFFTILDNKINQLKEKKALLEEYKKGMMQRIFVSNYDSKDFHEDHDFKNKKNQSNQGNQGNQEKSRFRQLRFKDDDGKKFADWEVKKLGEIGETYGGLSGKTKDDFGNGFPYIQYKQIFDDAEININNFELVNIDKDEKQKKVKFGDVFFTVSSETPDEIGMSSVLLNDIENLYLNSFCFGYRPNSLELLNPFFSKYLFRSEIFRKEIIKLAQGSTRYNMSKVQFLKLEISFPCSKEQTKIANFLSKIDDKIKTVSEQIEESKEYKKGLLQRMYCV